MNSASKLHTLLGSRPCTPDSGIQGLPENCCEELGFVSRPKFIGGSTIESYRSGTFEYNGLFWHMLVAWLAAAFNLGSQGDRRKTLLAEVIINMLKKIDLYRSVTWGYNGFEYEEN